MDAKLKSKTHLLNTFFYFLSRFLRIWLQSLKKGLIWPKNFFFEKNRKRCEKTQNFTLISNPLKKLWKNALFRHVFANNFFWYIFSKRFQRIRNQREILRFLTPFSILSEKIFFRSY